MGIDREPWREGPLTAEQRTRYIAEKHAAMDELREAGRDVATLTLAGDRERLRYAWQRADRLWKRIERLRRRLLSADQAAAA